jgi:hypothetical protein
MFRCHILASAAAALLLTCGVAQAHIVCHGEYQVVEGQEIETPYCGDNHVAAIARRHGMEVSNAEVRNDPATKDDICHWLRSDARVRPEC